jgi:hypothetical protein
MYNSYSMLRIDNVRPWWARETAKRHVRLNEVKHLFGARRTSAYLDEILHFVQNDSVGSWCAVSCGAPNNTGMPCHVERSETSPRNRMGIGEILHFVQNDNARQCQVVRYRCYCLRTCTRPVIVTRYFTAPLGSSPVFCGGPP